MWMISAVGAWLWGMLTAPLTILMELLVLLGSAAGCTIHLKDKGEVSIMFEQGVTVKHAAAKTDGDAEIGIDGKAIVNHIIDLREDGPAGAGDGG